MVRDASAYAALGLEPDADSAAIERAYKRLIKLHHPDREGGDSSRAAEINRAYRELRSNPATHDLYVADDEPLKRGGNGWASAAIVLIVAIGGLFLARQFLPVGAPAVPPGDVAGVAKTLPDAMDQPFDLSVIRSAVRQAVATSRDQEALLSASRDCNRILRQQPSVSRLDRCAAFDDAVVQLQDRDAMWDQSPFSELSVTGRQWSAASSLSNDYLAIDSRLERIRVQVELTLAPAAPPEKENSSN
jgi:hypothetical protein